MAYMAIRGGESWYSWRLAEKRRHMAPHYPNIVICIPKHVISSEHLDFCRFYSIFAREIGIGLSNGYERTIYAPDNHG